MPEPPTFRVRDLPARGWIPLGERPGTELAYGAVCRIARSTNAVSLLSEHSHPAISPANASTLQLLWQPTMLGP